MSIVWPQPGVCWPPYILTQVTKGAMDAAEDELKAARNLSAAEARYVLDVRLDRLVELGGLTSGEAQEIRGLVDGGTRSRPAAGAPISGVTIIQHAIADAGMRESESHPVTTALAAVGGAAVGAALGGPVGAVIGFIAGAEIAAHNL